MKITRVSMFSGIEHTLDIPVTQDQMTLWNSVNAPLLQQVFTNLTPDEREFIKTGITAEEWAQIEFESE